MLLSLLWGCSVSSGGVGGWGSVLFGTRLPVPLYGPHTVDAHIVMPLCLVQAAAVPEFGSCQ